MLVEENSNSVTRCPGWLSAWSMHDEIVLEIFLDSEIAVDAAKLLSFDSGIAYLTKPFSVEDLRLTDLVTC